MIPKIIHYCWLSNDPFPADIQKCMDSWKKYMPEYQVKRWSTENFDINSVPLVKEAYEAKKYAFAADYIRCYALYTEGGVYLDTDVLIYKNLEELFLDADFITSVEYHPFGSNTYNKQVDKNGYRRKECERVDGIGIQAAFMASTPAHTIVGECMRFYEHLNLNEVLSKNLLAPIIQVHQAEAFGFKYINEIQRLNNNVLIYPTSYIGQQRSETRGRYATHLCEGGWVNKSIKKQIINICNNYGIYHAYMRLKDSLGLIK